MSAATDIRLHGDSSLSTTVNFKSASAYSSAALLAAEIGCASLL